MAGEIVVEVLIDVPLEALLEAARGGSLEALGWAFEACRPRLIQLAVNQLGVDILQKEDATDLVQETFLEAFRDFEQFYGHTESEWMAWLRTILGHNVQHAVRRYKAAEKRQIRREVSLELIGPRGDRDAGLLANTTSPSGHAMRKERAEMIRRAVERLTERDREALFLRLQDQCTYDEMGRRMGCSGVAARNRWMGALDRLWLELGVSSMAR